MASGSRAWKGTVVVDPVHPERVGDVVETPGVSRIDFDADEYGGERAVWLDEGSDQVTLIGIGGRSYGLYVIVSWEDRSRDRSHLLLDCARAYLMNENGVTVDRLTTD